ATCRFEALQLLVRSVRNAKVEFNVEPGKKIAAAVQVADSGLREEFLKEVAALCLLGRLDPETLTISGMEGPPEDRAVHLVVQEGVEAYLPLSGLVDKDKERARLTKQAEKLRKEMGGLEARLNSPGFTDKAPATVVEKAREAYKEQQEQLQTIMQSINDLDN
ncbi:unnamed protein product, partial [Discosporangium mesarthrocarpum]